MENLSSCMKGRTTKKSYNLLHLYLSDTRIYFSPSFHFIDGVFERFNKYMNLENHSVVMFFTGHLSKSETVFGDEIFTAFHIYIYMLNLTPTNGH